MEHDLSALDWASLISNVPSDPEWQYLAPGDPSLVRMRDGRDVAVQVLGPDYGVPVISLHGNPGGSIGPHPLVSDLDEIGIRLLAPARAGYGRSTRHEGLSIGDTALDIEDIANAYGIECFGILARSGGVPHALGAAALLSSRVSGLVVMSGLAPEEADIDWTAGMTDDNKMVIHNDPHRNMESLTQSIRARAVATCRNRLSLMQELYPELNSDDRLIFMSVGLARAIAAGHREGLEQNGDGWIDETLAIHKPWGFNVSGIQAPTIVWHGGKDRFSDSSHSHWLAAQIQGAELQEHADESHFVNLLHVKSALLFLRDQHIGETYVRRIEAEYNARLQARDAELSHLWETTPFFRSGQAVDDALARELTIGLVTRDKHLLGGIMAQAVKAVLDT